MSFLFERWWGVVGVRGKGEEVMRALGLGE